jgi:hypothetical protein
MGVDENEAHAVRSQIQAHDKRAVPGLVRISFGLYNNEVEIDDLCHSLELIRDGKFKGVYHQDVPSGSFIPEGGKVDYDRYFTLEI